KDLQGFMRLELLLLQVHHLCGGLINAELAPIHEFVCLFQGADYLGAEAPALQTLGIDTHRPKRISGADDVRRNVLSNGACAANHAVSADADKLMDWGSSAKYGPIADMYMASQLYATGDDRLVSYLEFMGNMEISHSPVIVADSG